MLGNEHPEPGVAVPGSPESSPHLRTWPTWCVMFVGIPMNVVVSFVAMVSVAAVMEPGLVTADWMRSEDGMAAWIQTLVGKPMGLAVLILPGQAFFMLAVLIPAWLSRQPLSERLGFTRPTLSAPTWMMLALATPTIQIASGLFAGLFFDLENPSDQVKLLGDMLGGQTGWGLVLVLLVAAVLPGICEETFFRGFARVGLSRRRGFLVAILVPALLFAVAHGDPMHATAVLPLGIWFGLLAWWSRSVIPSILAHITNNAFAIFANSAPDPDMESDALLETITGGQGALDAVLGLSVGMFCWGLARLRRE